MGADRVISLHGYWHRQDIAGHDRADSGDRDGSGEDAEVLTPLRFTGPLKELTPIERQRAPVYRNQLKRQLRELEQSDLRGRLCLSVREPHSCVTSAHELMWVKAVVSGGGKRQQAMSSPAISPGNQGDALCPNQ